jgi:hypothetical protein
MPQGKKRKMTEEQERFVKLANAAKQENPSKPLPMKKLSALLEGRSTSGRSPTTRIKKRYTVSLM